MLNTAPIASVAPTAGLTPVNSTAGGGAPAGDETHPFSRELGRAEARQRAASGDTPAAADAANADAADPGREAPGVRHTDAAGTRTTAGARRGATPTFALRDTVTDLRTSTPAGAASTTQAANAHHGKAQTLASRETAADLRTPTPAAAANTSQAAGARHGKAQTLALRDALADLHTPTPADAAIEPAPGTGVPSIDSEPGALDAAAQVLSDLATLMSGLPVPHTAPTDGPATPSQGTHQAVQRSDQPGRSALAHEHAPGQRAAAARDTAQGSEHAASAFAQGTQALSMATLMRAAGADPHPTPAHGAHGAISLPVDPAAAAQGIRAITEAAWQGAAPTTAGERAQGSVDTFVTGATPLANPLQAATPRSEVAALPFQAELKAALGSSEFAPALGARLSMLVHDGIEHAQLKLNPAEMGQIEVRIRLDGSQAQVDFSAAHANTRQALQDAVPALASALRESGLTLTGGGVFEQPREQRGEPRPQETRTGFRPGEVAHDSVLTSTGVPRMPRARGVVDLYA